MSSPIPGTSGIFTESRTGVVVIATPNSMFVDVGGTTIEVGFLLPFLATAVSPPAAGTVVQLIRQDASWVATGRLVGAGSNSVLNPSFEDSPPGTEPVNWFTADASGGPAVAVVADIANAPDGDFVARVTSGVASTHILYSSPIAVTVGETWSLAAFVGGEYGGNPSETADAALIAMWFANATDLFPTTSAVDSIVDTEADVPQYPPFRTLSGTVVVPAGGAFMRVVLRSTLAADQGLVWDQVSARRV